MRGVIAVSCVTQRALVFSMQAARIAAASVRLLAYRSRNSLRAQRTKTFLPMLSF